MRKLATQCIATILVATFIANPATAAALCSFWISAPDTTVSTSQDIFASEAFIFRLLDLRLPWAKKQRIEEVKSIIDSQNVTSHWVTAAYAVTVLGFLFGILLQPGHWSKKAILMGIHAIGAVAYLKGNGNGELPRLQAELTEALDRYLRQRFEIPSDQVALTTKNLARLKKLFDESSPIQRIAISDDLWHLCQPLAQYLTQVRVAQGRRAGERAITHFPRRYKDPIVVPAIAHALKFPMYLVPVNPADADGPLRISNETIGAGGAPVHVMAALESWDANYISVGVDGKGPVSDLFSRLMDLDGFDRSSWSPGDSDTSFQLMMFVNQEAGVKEFRFTPPPRPLSPHIRERLLEKFEKVCAQAGRGGKGLVLLGSRPPAGDKSLLPELFRIAAAHHLVRIYDPQPDVLKDPELRELLFQGGIDIYSPNREEFALSVGMPPQMLSGDVDESEIVDLARRELIVKYGIRYVIVSLDSHGALWISEKQVFKAQAPKTMALDPLAAGDVSLAAAIHNLSYNVVGPLLNPWGNPYPDALRLFVSAGTSKVLLKDQLPSATEVLAFDRFRGTKTPPKWIRLSDRTVLEANAQVLDIYPGDGKEKLSVSFHEPILAIALSPEEDSVVVALETLSEAYPHLLFYLIPFAFDDRGLVSGFLADQRVLLLSLPSISGNPLQGMACSTQGHTLRVAFSRRTYDYDAIADVGESTALISI